MTGTAPTITPGEYIESEGWWITDRTHGYGLGRTVEPGGFSEISEGPLAGRGLYLTLPRGTPALADWTSSLHASLHHVLSGAFAPAMLLGATVWALGAAVVPLLAGGTGRRRIGLAGAWSGSVLLLSAGVLSIAPAGVALRPVPATVGALAAALLILVRVPGDPRPSLG